MPETNVGGWQGPPAGFGLQWQPPRELKVSGVLKALWTAEGPSQDYDDALAGPEGRSLRNLGFAYDRMRGGLPCYWEGVHADPRQVECLVNTAVRGLDAYRAEVDRERAEKADRKALAAAAVARRAAEDLALAERAIAAARESLRTQAWAWAVRDDVETAERRIARGPVGMERYQSEHLLDLVARAQANIDRAMRAMEIPYDPEAERAALPEVQAAAHEACRLLTARDADRAGIRNQTAQSSGAAEGAVVVSPIGRGLVQGLAHTRSVHEVNLVGFYEARCAKGGDHRRREHAPAEAPMDVILVERASQLIAQAAVYLAEGHDAVKDAAIGSELDALVDAAIEVSRNAQTIVERLEGAVPNQGPAGIGDCRS